MDDSVDQGRQQRAGDSQSSGDSSVLAYMASDPDPHSVDENRPFSPPNDLSTTQSSSINASQFPERTNIPTRASTVSSPHDHDQRKARSDEPPHARSEDLNHTTVRNMDDLHISDQSPFRAQQFLSANSRPTTPASGSTTLVQPPSDPSASFVNRPSSAHSDSSAYSDASAGGGSAPAGTSTTHTSASIAST